MQLANLDISLPVMEQVPRNTVLSQETLNKLLQPQTKRLRQLSGVSIRTDGQQNTSATLLQVEVGYFFLER